MTRPPSIRRVVGLFGVSFGLMMLISLVFYALKGPDGLNIPWLSVAISLGAVLAPALAVCYYPAEGAPGALPSFKAVSPWLVAGAACFSLPLYMLFACLQIAAGRLLPVHLDAGLVQPLTAAGPLSLLWIWLSIAVIPALTEETMYRGVIQQATIGKYGPRWGLLAAAVVFSLAHMEPAGALSRVLMGLWFGYLFYRTGSLWPGAIAHALNNSWGVALANWHEPLGHHMPWVYTAGALAALAGYGCLYLAGLWPWHARPALAAGAPADGPELPYFVQVRRPEPPRLD